MSVISWIADRLILCPSTHSIDPEGKRRELIATTDGQIEAWVGQYSNNSAKSTELVVLKFPGTSGRAERSSVHPVEIWNVPAEIWTINQKGYGGSSGPASIKYFPNSSRAAFEHIKGIYPNLPIVVTGNSLGCISALYLAANESVLAVLLRNPPPVQQMIKSRPKYSAWNFGLSRVIADEVPNELDCIENAKKASAPCLFIQSEKDRVVPVKYQNLILDAYRGPKRLFQIRDADHHETISECESEPYIGAVRWLGNSFCNGAN